MKPPQHKEGYGRIRYVIMFQLLKINLYICNQYYLRKKHLHFYSQKGEKMSRSEVKAMIDEVDENKDGKLDYKEVN